MLKCKALKSLCDYDNFLQFKESGLLAFIYILYLAGWLIKNKYSDNNLTQTFKFIPLSPTRSCNYLCSQMENVFSLSFLWVQVRFSSNFCHKFSFSCFRLSCLHVPPPDNIWHSWQELASRRNEQYLCDL